MVMEGSTFGGHSSHLEKCAHPCRGQTYGKNSENAPPAPKMLWLAHGSFIQGGVPGIRSKGYLGLSFLQSGSRRHLRGCIQNVHFDTPSIVLGRAYSKKCAIMPSKRS